MKMNANQAKALEIASKGHNLLLIGAAGTGKSFTIQKIVDIMEGYGKKVQITCSTGIACSVYEKKYKVCTLHRYLGLIDGRYGPEQILKIHKNSSKFDYVRRNLEEIDCLVVDECSMVSERTFEMVNAVCRTKNEHLNLGGIQIIFCGDFHQLPPVANLLYQDNGKYCFESPVFNDVFAHRVVLTENTRTHENSLVKTIDEVFNGHVSNESEDFLKYLNRPLNKAGESDSIKLFSKNDIVDDYNRTSLLNFSGQMYEYKSENTGAVPALQSISAPKTLWLKTGCPVILLQNLTDDLVNGLRGKVKSLENGPLVEFDNGMIQSIPRMKFSVFSPAVNKDIATRVQYPLKPAFGLTIHKAQGMTLDRVEVDCRDIFMAGQLGVALSRARDIEGLRVINYHPRYIIRPAQTVKDFIAKNSMEIHADFSCCRNHICQPTIETRTDINQKFGGYTEGDSQPSEIDFDVEMEDDENFEDDFDKVVATITREEEQMVNFDLPDDFDLNLLKEKVKIEKVVTTCHKKMNEIISRLQDTPLIAFVKKLFMRIKDIIISTIKDSDVPKGIPEKNLAMFLQSIHKYSTSAEYQMISLILFQHETVFTDEHKIICYKVLEFVKLFFIQKKVDLLQIPSNKLSKRYVTNASRARIRYVAGYCIASLRRKYVKMQRTNMYGNSKCAHDIYYTAKCKVKILNLMKEDENFLKENTSEPESLVDIERKQNIRHGLTNVADSSFNFFVSLTETCLTYLTNENLLQHGKNMYSECFSKIFNDMQLFEAFASVIAQRSANEKLEEFGAQQFVAADESGHFEVVTDSLVLHAEQINCLFKEIAEKYLHVLFAQFRKDIKYATKIEKKMAHRKQVKVGKVSKKASEKAASKEQMNPVASQSSDVQVSTTQTDVESTDTAVDSTTESVFEPQPGTSATTDESDLCKKCMSDRPDEWIQCDSCDNWFYRKCACLSNAKLWKKISISTADWFCKDCK